MPWRAMVAAADPGDAGMAALQDMSRRIRSEELEAWIAEASGDALEALELVKKLVILRALQAQRPFLENFQSGRTFPGLESPVVPRVRTFQGYVVLRWDRVTYHPGGGLTFETIKRDAGRASYPRSTFESPAWVAEDGWALEQQFTALRLAAENLSQACTHARRSARALEALGALGKEGAGEDAEADLQLILGPPARFKAAR
ncbi:MAG: hypothetical protein HUK26_04575 [Duodenibacillus sp.]|nr:hypothetical protein [Duodenibacillus sp.]